MKNLLILTSFIFLFGCSANWHAQQARRHELIAISKGAKISHDTIYKTVFVKVFVPGDSGSVNLDPTFDLDGFGSDIGKNDSLVTEINRLKNDSLGTALDKERTLALLVKANKDLTSLRARLIRGYSKDSTYVFAPDSITTISVELKDGTIKKLDYKRLDTTLSNEQMIPIEIQKIFQLGYKHWQVYAAIAVVGIILLIIGFIMGRVTKSG